MLIPGGAAPLAAALLAAAASILLAASAEASEATRLRPLASIDQRDGEEVSSASEDSETPDTDGETSRGESESRERTTETEAPAAAKPPHKMATPQPADAAKPAQQAPVRSWPFQSAVPAPKAQAKPVPAATPSAVVNAPAPPVAEKGAAPMAATPAVPASAAPAPAAAAPAAADADAAPGLKTPGGPTVKTTAYANKQKVSRGGEDVDRPHPMAEANPDHMVVVCEGGCDRKPGVVVLFKPIETMASTGELVPASGGGAQDTDGAVLCLAGCDGKRRSFILETPDEMAPTPAAAAAPVAKPAPGAAPQAAARKRSTVSTDWFTRINKAE